MGLFSLIVPVLALLVSASIVLFPALARYESLKNAPRSRDDKGIVRVVVGTGLIQLGIPADRLGRFVLEAEAMRGEGLSSFLNAPGKLLYSLLAAMTGHNGNWFPQSADPFIWRVAMVSLCAIPSWWFVGRGLDGLFREQPLFRADLIVSLALLSITGTLSAVLRIGLSDEERAGEGLLPWFLGGLACWAVLFAVPFGAWLYQRVLRRRPA
jgi:hypothetical protein